MELPHSVIEDILLLLPSDSLSRFRKVSKQWNTTILSQHRKKQLSNNASSNTHLWRQTFGQKLGNAAFTLLGLDHQRKGKIYTPQQFPPCSTFRQELQFSSTCHGWVCPLTRTRCLQKYQMLIHNPFSSVTLVVSQCPPGPPQERYSVYAALGHDPASRDYKVMVFQEGPNQNQVDVLSLQTEEWTSVECPTLKDYTLLPSELVAVDGSINLISYTKKEQHQVWVILRFNLANYQLSVILPPADANFPLSKKTVSLHNGSLCLYIYGSSCEANKPDDVIFDIWILKEETLTWSKLTRITIAWSYIKKYSYRVIGLSADGEHLLLFNCDDPYLFVWDLKQKIFQQLRYGRGSPLLLDEETLSSHVRMLHAPMKKKKAWPWFFYCFL